MARDSKVWLATRSLLWALFLTLAKLITGLITNSLGILSEALHSGLDLLAAGMTVYAVSASSRPADTDHHFGHGKVENLSALVETVLLVGTSVFIVYEAISRLLVGDDEITVSVWSFIVMIAAIFVDLRRSRELRRGAHEYRSQALEADALHFSSDVLGSLAVIAGLIGTANGFPWADPLAALTVAIVILVSAGRLIKRTLDALLDRAPDGVTTEIERRISHVPGVSGTVKTRLRPQGESLHVDVVIQVDSGLSLKEAHKTADAVEAAIQRDFPGADINVHVEPAQEPPQGTVLGQEEGPEDRTPQV